LWNKKAAGGAPAARYSIELNQMISCKGGAISISKIANLFFDIAFEPPL
jgi:hypothetical protein